MAYDIKRRVGSLKGDVYVVSGLVKGKTLLPLPPQADAAVEAAELHLQYFTAINIPVLLYFRGKPFEKHLIHTVETAVIEWSHQIHAILRKNSSQILLDQKNPGPLVEIDFWKNRMLDLESIVEQMFDEKAQKMTWLLERTQSSYYIALQNMVSPIHEQ